MSDLTYISATFGDFEKDAPLFFDVQKYLESQTSPETQKLVNKTFKSHKNPKNYYGLMAAYTYNIATLIERKISFLMIDVEDNSKYFSNEKERKNLAITCFIFSFFGILAAMRRFKHEFLEEDYVGEVIVAISNEISKFSKDIEFKKMYCNEGHNLSIELLKQYSESEQGEKFLNDLENSILSYSLAIQKFDKKTVIEHIKQYFERFYEFVDENI